MKHPDWNDVMKGCAWSAEDAATANDLISVTRETLQLSMSAIKDVTAREAYHNYMAAWREIEDALALPQSCHANDGAMK